MIDTSHSYSWFFWRWKTKLERVLLLSVEIGCIVVINTASFILHLKGICKEAIEFCKAHHKLPQEEDREGRPARWYWRVRRPYNKALFVSYRALHVSYKWHFFRSFYSSRLYLIPGYMCLWQYKWWIWASNSSASSGWLQHVWILAQAKEALCTWQSRGSQGQAHWWAYYIHTHQR